MGAKSSRGVASNGLTEPLLPLYHQVHPGLQGVPDGSGVSGSASAPASFKAGKPRKTKHFIGDEILHSTSRPVWEAPTDVDPRLLDEERTMQAISEQVASLLSRYIEEGRSKPQDKDEDEFHEDHFLRRRFCSCCPFRSRTPIPSKETILDFLNKIAESLYFCKQVVVLCAIYIERLLQRTDTVLTTGNWRSLVIAGMLIASKVWEDIHPWNADFEECLVEIAGIRYRNGALYRLESLFLEKLQWRVFVDGEIYAAYFFSLQEGRQSERHPSPGSRPRKAQRLQRHHSDVSNFAIMPIIEDEPLVESETDIEKALASPHNPYDFSGSTMSTDSSVSQASQMDMDLPQQHGETLSDIRSCWRLDAGNPHIGSLRHAPRALAPSKHIQQSQELLWAHKLATKTTELFGHRKSQYSEAHTLSGATGNQLQTELLQYLKNKRGEDKTTKKDAARAGEITLNMLEEKRLWPEAIEAMV